MSLRRLESQGLIERIKFSDKQITSNIKRASKDLLTAEANIEIDEEWAYTISYHAMSPTKTQTRNTDNPVPNVRD